MNTSKIFVKKTRKGSVLKVVREHYLRDDIGCGSSLCNICPTLEEGLVGNLQSQPEALISDLCPHGHYLIPDTNIVLHQIFVVSLVATSASLLMLMVVSAAPTPEVGYEEPPPSQSEIYHDQSGYGKYRFGYKVNDAYTGNHQTRHEERDEDGTVRGHYSLLEPDGNVRVVYYIADKYGFRAYVKNTYKPDSVHGNVHSYGDYGRR